MPGSLIPTACLQALVPVAQLSPLGEYIGKTDIGERKVNPVNHYLEGLNNSLCLLTSAVSYPNQLRKEVARIYVHESALADICKWDCEVGTTELFPFDVPKKSKEVRPLQTSSQETLLSPTFEI